MFLIFYLQLLQSADGVLPLAVTLQSHYRGVYGHDLLYANLPQLLPLPKVKACLRLHQSEPKPKPPHQRRRIRNMDDIYDSEESSESFLTLTDKATNHSDVEEPSTNNTSEPPPKTNTGCKIVTDSLFAMSRLYDSFSTSDSYLACRMSELHCGHGYDVHLVPNRAQPGLTNHRPNFDEKNWWRRYWGEDIAAAVATAEVARTRKSLSEALAQKATYTEQSASLYEQMVLAVEEPTERLRLEAYSVSHTR